MNSCPKRPAYTHGWRPRCCGRESDAVPKSAKDAMGRVTLGTCVTRRKQTGIWWLEAYKGLFLPHLKESVLEALKSGPQGHPGTPGPVLQSPREGLSTGVPQPPRNPQIELRRGDV